MTIKNNQRWTSSDINKLLRLMREGYKTEYIAKMMQRSPNAISQKVNKLRSDINGNPAKRKKVSPPQAMQLPLAEDMWELPSVEPEPEVVAKPVREIPNTPIVKPKQLMEQQGWWSKLRHGNLSLKARVKYLEAEVRDIHTALNKLLSELGEDKC
jgi:hypothetical protein